MKNLMTFLFSINIKTTGVKSVETDVPAKAVTVEADDSVTPQFMLEKLEKVSTIVRFI